MKDNFGDDNIFSSIIVNNWEIDFYIKTYNIYIQFDGVYWHGLDRTIKKIKESNTQRDKAILKTMKRDKTQNKWFEKQNLKLIRITDKEFETNKKGIVEHIISA